MNGTTSATFQFIVETPRPDDISFVVNHTMAKGTFSVHGIGTFDTSTGDFRLLGGVQDGAGKFDDAFGVLRYVGSLDFSTGRFTETIRGVICLDNGRDR